MKAKNIKSLLVPMFGILSVGVVTPMVMSSCGDEKVAVNDVKLNKSSLSLGTDITEQLTVKFVPENATNKKVTWKSDDPSIATVDENGWVKAVAKGKTIITVTTEDGSKTDICEVTTFVSIKNLKLDKTKLGLAVGHTGQLAVIISPEDAANKNVTWSSSNESVATVGSNGLVKAVSEGTTTITATANDGSGKTASCEVTVGGVDPSGITLDQTSFNLPLNTSKQLTATVLPENAYDKEVSWSSDNNSVAKVDLNGLVTAVSEGKATITARTNVGDKKATCEVTVVFVPASGVELNEKELRLTVGDNNKQLTATVLPTDATNKNVTWKSSDENIARVDQTGLVTPISPGEATITVTTEDSKKTDECKVHVFTAIEKFDIGLKKSDGSLEPLIGTYTFTTDDFQPGKSLYFEPIVIPNTQTTPPYSVTSWETSDTTVATFVPETPGKLVVHDNNAKSFFVITLKVKENFSGKEHEQKVRILLKRA